MKVSFTGLRLTAVAGVLTGHFYNHKKKTSRSTGGLVGSLICTYLIAILIKSTDQVISDHPGTAAFYIMPLDEVYQLPVFEQGDGR